MNEEIDIWYSEYELRGFIHTATRWNIDLCYEAKNDKHPYGQFTNEVYHARENFEKFATQLNRKLASAGNWKSIELDLNSRFIVMINRYIDWYTENKSKLEKFQPYCPYTIMLSVIESTKNEIQKYFPNIGSRKGDQTDKAPDQKHTNAEPVKKRGRKPQPIPPGNLELKDVFEDSSKYRHIISLLINEGYCDETTGCYISSQHRTKTRLAALIKHLHTLGLYKDNKSLTPQQIKVISCNTFGCNMDINTINKADPREFKFAFLNVSK